MSLLRRVVHEVHQLLRHVHGSNKISSQMNDIYELASSSSTSVVAMKMALYKVSSINDDKS